MAATPFFKVYDASGAYQASVKEPEAGAALLAFYGPGSTLRCALSVGRTDALFTNGTDGDAAESFDLVAEVAYRNLAALRAKRFASV